MRHEKKSLKSNQNEYIKIELKIDKKALENKKLELNKNAWQEKELKIEKHKNESKRSDAKKEKECDIKMHELKQKQELQQAGITIIALVVTVIILLILAGITISMVNSNGGILSKAKNAAEVSEKSSAEEEMSMYLASIEVSKSQDGDQKRLADYIQDDLGNGEVEDFLNNGDGYAQVGYKGHNYMVNLDDGSFTYIGKTDGKGVNRHIRQVLSSNNQDVPGIAMVEAGEIETEDLGWKVLSTNSDGTVNLIANTNTSFEVSISGINGYTNGVKALNEICSKLYGNLEINGKKVLSARSANVEDFYNVTYYVARKYENGKKIEPKINQLDTANNGYSKDQISNYIDISNTSGSQSSNLQMLVANTSPTIMNMNRTNKATINMISTGNNYWLATRTAYSGCNLGSDGKTPYSEDRSYECYRITCIRTDGELSSKDMFYIDQYNTTGENGNENCSIRPVITVSADSVQDKSEGATVNVDRFYKNKESTEAKGYVKADSIATLLGKDIKSVNKVNSGLPTVESDMTWSKLTDGGYDLQSGSFDTSKYDYYIADRTTKLQVRLTGAPAYNNGVLALDTICNNLYGNLTEIKLKNGRTKKVKVVLARNAKWEDFLDESKFTGNLYGGVWTTNANDSSAPNKITVIQESYAPTLFTQYENIDKTKGVSKGYSDAKITSYNMSTQGTDSWLEENQKKSYAYERYNYDKKSSNPWLKVIYNAEGNETNRNTSNINVGSEYWLSSRSTSANWYNANFYMRYVSGNKTIKCNSLFASHLIAESHSKNLRPVLQVEK